MRRAFAPKPARTRTPFLDIVDPVGGGFIPTLGQGAGARARVPDKGRTQ
jgi:hypothetical protein